jgi:2-dehydro-3-deoxyphosphogluconate aldolase / (4S)-4-hydroxy-2-oxoglutarate aldolase
VRDIGSIMAMAPVIPVLVIDRVEDAVAVAQALVDGGLPVLEVTLRTPAALPALRAMKQVTGAIVGAGTILNPHQYEQACEAGAEFVVSPGLTAQLAKAACTGPAPLLPGVSTTSDIMNALDHGFTHLKFFPASSIGLPALKGMSAVFPNVSFCPTGGISLETAPDWLAVRAVVCVGGSWLAPPGSQTDTAAIRQRAIAAATLEPRKQ